MPSNSKIPFIDLTDTLNTQRLRTNQLIDSIGNITSLTTTADNITAAINEHDAELGTITAGAMGTTASTVSNAIAELDGRLDSINDTELLSPRATLSDSSATNIVRGNLQVDTNITAGSLIVEGITNLDSANVVGDLDVTGDVDVTGNVSVGGDVDVTGNFTTITTDGLTEGSNLYFTTARARSSFSAGTGIGISSGVVSLTDTALGAVLTINGTANEIDVSRSNGTVTIGLPSDVLIDSNLTVGGAFTVQGDFTVAGAQKLEGQYVFLLDGFDGVPSFDAGISVDRGNEDSAVFQWKESGDYWEAGTTTDKRQIARQFDSAAFTNIQQTGSGALRLPAGTTAERPTAAQGQIRYNKTTTSFEGYNGSSWGSLGGLIDVDQDTKIIAERASGTDSDTLQFITAGALRATLNSTVLDITTDSGITVGNTRFFDGGVDYTGTLNINAATNVGGNLGVTGSVDATTDFTVGTTTISSGTIADTGTLNIDAPADIGGNLDVTGNITVSGTVDGVDIASRNAVLTSTTTTANAALPKSGGTMTGNIVFNAGQTFDGRDVSADGSKLDGIEAGAKDDQTITAGTGLTGGGTGDVTISHDDTSSQASVSNTGRTYIQSITLDTFGHITALSSATETVVNTDTTYSAGADLDLTGTTFSLESTLNSVTTITNTGNIEISSTGSGTNVEVVSNTGTATLDGVNAVLNGTTLTQLNSAANIELNASGSLLIDVTGNVTSKADANYYFRKDNSAQSYFGFYSDSAANDRFLRIHTASQTDTKNEQVIFSDGNVRLVAGVDGSPTYVPYTGDIPDLPSILLDDTTDEIVVSSKNAFGAIDLVVMNHDGPGDGDEFATIKFRAFNRDGIDDGNLEDFAQIIARVDDNTITTEDGSLLFETMINGTMTTGMTLTGLDLTVQGDVTSLSDKRVKENIETVENGLDLVSQLRGVWYNKIGEEDRKVGVIAQEVEEVLPEVVKTDTEGMKSVDYGKMVGVLIEAIKDLKAEIKELKAGN